jgi:hypothetical protein
MGMQTIRMILAGLLLCLGLSAQTQVHYVPLNPVGVPLVAKWTVANSSTNLLITQPTGATSTVAKAAATTQSVTLFALPAKSTILSCTIKSDTAFTGTTTLTATVGITGMLTACISTPFDLKAAVSNTNLAITLPTTPVLSWAGTNLILALTATVDNISSVSAGAVEVQLVYTILQ